MGFLNWIKEELCRGSNPPSGNTMQRSNCNGRRQAQFLQIPPPGANPVATDRELLEVARPPFLIDEARRALYNRGRSDERTAILRALGVKP
jgi:hypothetical protein